MTYVSNGGGIVYWNVQYVKERNLLIQCTIKYMELNTD